MQRQSGTTIIGPKRSHRSHPDCRSIHPDCRATAIYWEPSAACWKRSRLTIAGRTSSRRLATTHFPLQDAIATLEGLSNEAGRIEGVVRSMPVPENDRMTQRYRQEAETLAHLCELDQHLVGQAESLQRMLQGRNAAFLLAHAPDYQQGFAAITQTIRDRQALLV